MDDIARLNRWRPRLVERNHRILALRAQNMTLRAIGKEVGCSTERVRQILLLHQWRTERQAEIAKKPPE